MSVTCGGKVLSLHSVSVLADDETTPVHESLKKSLKQELSNSIMYQLVQAIPQIKQKIGLAGMARRKHNKKYFFR